MVTISAKVKAKARDFSSMRDLSVGAPHGRESLRKVNCELSARQYFHKEKRHLLAEMAFWVKTLAMTYSCMA